MIRAWLERLMTPSYDSLVNRANHELHQFQILKYRNYEAALVHRRRSDELFRRAREMKK